MRRLCSILTPANAEIMHKVTTMFREEPEWPQYCNLIDMSIRALTPQERPANTVTAPRSGCFCWMYTADAELPED